MGAKEMALGEKQKENYVREATNILCENYQLRKISM